LISAITVPSLVGLNLSGAGGSVVRWLTIVDYEKTYETAIIQAAQSRPDNDDRRQAPGAPFPGITAREDGPRSQSAGDTGP
jgi:hypothetical protein